MDLKLPNREFLYSSEVQYMCRLGTGKFMAILNELGIERTKQGRGLVISHQDAHKVVSHIRSKGKADNTPRPEKLIDEAISEASPKVRLTLKQIELAAWAGVQRQANRISKGQYDHNWQNHVEGCLAEFAVASYLGKHWDGAIGIPGPGDIGRKIEVRSTGVADGRLLLKETDQTNADWVLVIGSNGDYQLMGWLEGIQAKQQKYLGKLKAGGETLYIIPRTELKPMYWLKQGR